MEEDADRADGEARPRFDAPVPVGRAALEAWTIAQLPVPLAIYDTDVRLVQANRTMARLLGASPEEMQGRRLRDVAPGQGFEEFERLQEEVVRTGELVHLENFARRFRDDTGERAWSVLFFPLKDEDGVVRGVSAAVFDATEEHWARQRLAILSEASLCIGTTLDVNRTAQELADVACGRFADFVSVNLLDAVVQGGEPAAVAAGEPVPVRRAAQRSVLPGCPESVVGLGESEVYPAVSPPARVLAGGGAARHSIRDAPVSAWLVNDPDRARTITEYGIHTLMLVPLRARGTTLGIALFLRHRTQEPFSADDLMLAEEITTRAAVCVDNARRYTRERNTALTLQRRLLPRRMPRQAAVEAAFRYLPAGSRAGVGGDWFDVIPLSGARVALVVGDVVGHGIHASATMGRLRTAVRTLADLDLQPDELLTHLDDLVIRLDEEEEAPPEGEPSGAVGSEVGATCLYAVYDPVSRRCCMARAGHPAPAVVRPDGTVDFPDVPAGPPLGLGGLPFEVADLEVPEGSLLALYTDGLVESAARDIDRGLALLRDALTRPARSLDHICDNVLAALLPERPADDIALLVARTRALDAGRVVTWDLPPDPVIVSDARKKVVEQLALWGLEDAVFTTELVVSELVTNAIRYSEGPIRLRLIRDTALICEVSDSSSTAPHLRRARVFDEGGRGLLLVAQLTQRWGTRQTPSGKTIWAEQGLPEADNLPRGVG